MRAINVSIVREAHKETAGPFDSSRRQLHQRVRLSPPSPDTVAALAAAAITMSTKLVGAGRLPGNGSAGAQQPSGIVDIVGATAADAAAVRGAGGSCRQQLQPRLTLL